MPTMLIHIIEIAAGVVLAGLVLEGINLAVAALGLRAFFGQDN